MINTLSGEITYLSSKWMFLENINDFSMEKIWISYLIYYKTRLKQLRFTIDFIMFINVLNKQ